MAVDRFDRVLCKFGRRQQVMLHCVTNHDDSQARKSDVLFSNLKVVMNSGFSVVVNQSIVKILAKFYQYGYNFSTCFFKRKMLVHLFVLHTCLAKLQYWKLSITI